MIILSLFVICHNFSFVTVCHLLLSPVFRCLTIVFICPLSLFVLCRWLSFVVIFRLLFFVVIWVKKWHYTHMSGLCLLNWNSQLQMGVWLDGMGLNAPCKAKKIIRQGRKFSGDNSNLKWVNLRHLSVLHNCNAVSELVHIAVLPPCWATLHPLDRSCVWIWDMEFRVLLDCQILTPPPHVAVQLPQEPHAPQVASTARGDICQFSWAIKSLI